VRIFREHPGRFQTILGPAALGAPAAIADAARQHHIERSAVDAALAAGEESWASLSSLGPHIQAPVPAAMVRRGDRRLLPKDSRDHGRRCIMLSKLSPAGLDRGLAWVYLRAFRKRTSPCCALVGLLLQ
jgi:hypothetical protein